MSRQIPTSTARQAHEESSDDSPTRTMELPAVAELLKAGEPPVQGGEAAFAQSIEQRLDRLIELSESMNGILDEIAAALDKRPSRSSRKSRRKSATARRNAAKSAGNAAS